MKKITFLFLVLPFLGLSQVQVGQDIYGDNASDQSGFDVSISDNGNIIAVGTPSSDGNGENSGHVRIFENLNGVWTQIGDDIIGEAIINASGSSIDISSDGTIIVIGAYLNAGNG